MAGPAVTMREGSTPATSIAAALDALDAAGFEHCVWKGSDHLAASLDGGHDLDVLVGNGTLPDIARVLRDAGLVATSNRGPQRAGVDDWLGAHPTTGAVVHLQLYTRLLIDDRLVDRWELPFVADVVASRWRASCGVWVASAAVEAVLLCIQAAARPTDVSDLRTRLAALEAIPEDAGAVASSWLGDDVGRAVEEALLHGVDAGGAAERIRSAVKRALADHTVHGPVRRRADTALVLARKLWRRAAGSSVRVARRGRVPAGGGAVIAIVGPDGAGKSSLVRDLTSELGSKLDARTIYFGSGDGPASLVRWPLNQARRLTRGVTAARPAVTGASEGPRRIGAAKATWALVLAYEKGRKIDSARQARESGAVVICDRFPQVQVVGINDGPLLAGWDASRTVWRRRLAGWERERYQAAADLRPELVLRLDVSLPVAAARRADHERSDLERRIEIVRSLRFPSAGSVVVLDADAPQAEVRRAALTAVMRVLGGPA